MSAPPRSAVEPALEAAPDTAGHYTVLSV
ncbi:hypothetical protein XACW160_710155 [Xanthomonas citri pv. citri]|uniref:Uncharacterized protein n=1 Tax=Xanthomonas citri pv. citri TaxID=611301 RepID=A0A0U5FKT3_XANCI|nr:hypothetical protein XAC902_1040181 [Xanthomonas citri pv. citri]CEE48445.1 hypothetical protein XAC2911_790179 [Xanthomonas citri pv. citri]CEE76025.1 hypothetical protein XACW160_710155 [Xanthomonas citri pv. citri]CEE80420.1 hypothetical protein XAC2852_790181 [Xanthomonas citri pv. citri]CEE89181.1 hypothetical protein XAC3218_910126 [Xanthomonas citri pv. citri]